MSTIRQELHALVERVPPEREERVLKALRHIVDCQIPERDETSSVNFDELMHRHMKKVGQRLGLDVDQLPHNGGWTGGISGDRVEFTKDWETEDARHRLSKIDMQGHDIVLLERMETVGNTDLRYQVRVLTDKSEGRAEVNLPL